MLVASDQADDFRIPEVEKMLVLAVDATSRVYDLNALDLGTPGLSYDATKPGKWVYLTFEAEGADIFYAVSSDGTRTISDTAKITAGTPPAFSVTGCSRILKDSSTSRRIDRNLHRYLYLKTASGTGTVRIQASSGASTWPLP